MDSSSASSSSSSSVGFPLSVNRESSESSPPLHSSSSLVGIPLNENSQSTENRPNQQIPSNGRQTISDVEWNEELTKLFTDEKFCKFMKGSLCEHPFVDWYRCMNRAVYFGGDLANCRRLSGLLKDCIFSNPEHFQPLLRRFSERTRR